jgi:hypothetical protein
MKAGRGSSALPVCEHAVESAAPRDVLRDQVRQGTASTMHQEALQVLVAGLVARKVADINMGGPRLHLCNPFESSMSPIRFLRLRRFFLQCEDEMAD